MSLLVKRKTLNDTELADLLGFVLPKVVTGMQDKRMVTTLSFERATELGNQTRALMDLLEQHVKSVSTTSLDVLVDDTLRCILAFASHAARLNFRRTSRRHRALVDSLSSMSVARLPSRLPKLALITKCPTLPCVLASKTVASLNHSLPETKHRVALKEMSALRTVMLRFSLDSSWMNDARRGALAKEFDKVASPIALRMNNRGYGGPTMPTLSDIELLLGRRVESVLFVAPAIPGLFDKSRQFRRLALCAKDMGTRTLFQVGAMVVEQLLVRVDGPGGDDIARLLTTGAPPPLMKLASGWTPKACGPTLILEIECRASFEWVPAHLEKLLEYFSRVHVLCGHEMGHMFVCNASAVHDNLKTLLGKEPKLAARITQNERVSMDHPQSFLDA